MIVVLVGLGGSAMVLYGGVGGGHVGRAIKVVLGNLLLIEALWEYSIVFVHVWERREVANIARVSTAVSLEIAYARMFRHR